MPLKKLQEKCKKIGRTRLPCTVPNRFALPSTTTKNNVCCLAYGVNLSAISLFEWDCTRVSYTTI